LLAYYRVPSSQDLYYKIAKGVIDLKDLKEFNNEKNHIKPKVAPKVEQNSLENMVKNARGSSEMLIIGENMDKMDYKLSPCCNPIPGDDVFGFITISDGIKIHRTNCPNAMQLMSNFAYRIVKAKWTSQKEIAFLAGIRMTGIDEVGVVNNITRVISSQLKVNMRSISIDSNDGVFEGTIMLFVHNTDHLTTLMKQLGKVNGILTVNRIDVN
jgi:guanosine-3',5'-bis(diphosphate) 3'-pyrophosphohydrolase